MSFQKVVKQNPFDFKQVILGVTYDESIEELYNKVKVVVESESKLEKPKEKKVATKKGDKKKEVKKEVKKEIVDLATKDNAPIPYRNNVIIFCKR